MAVSGLKYLLAFALSLIVSFTAIPFVIRLGNKLGIVNRPSSDRWNEREVPQIVGVAIFSGSWVGFCNQRTTIHGLIDP